MNSFISNNESLFSKIADLLIFARKRIVQSVHQTMSMTYFEIGRMIVEEEQNGKERATYGKQVLKELSKRLTSEFGKGFSVENLDRMRFFYKTYASQISSTVLTNSDFDNTIQYQFKLSWSHYLMLMRIDTIEERRFYEIEAIENNWSLRELQRQFNSALFERLSLSRDRHQVKILSEKGQIVEKPQDAMKDPYVLEFLGIPESEKFSETDLEQKLIDKLEHFLLELGKGFTFVGRQVRFSFDDKHFRVDLVFYNRILQCFVLIDLKIGEITHQDLGQMQMYVNYYDRFVKLDTENKTIGIILCKKKNDTLVEITLPENNEQIFASKYLTVLPSKKELKDLINNKDF